MLPYNTSAQNEMGNMQGGQPLSIHHQMLPMPNPPQKRPYVEAEGQLMMEDSLERPAPKKKGRKKSFIWAHVVTDEMGKVHCKHCGALIRVNYGEKVERLRRHFIKNCPKNPFSKDSKEYEELIEAVSAPAADHKRKSFIPQGKTKNNRVISYSVGFVATVLTAPSMELTPEQIQQLESQGNRSSNWAGVKLTGSPTASYDNSLDKIRNCHFSGNIYIGVFVKNAAMAHGVSVPCGLYNSNFSGTCILSDNCYIFNTSMLCNVFIGRNSCIVNCGMVICEGQTSFGTQRMICVGPESDSPGNVGARTITLNVNASYSEICTAALHPKKDIIDNEDPSKKKGSSMYNNMRTNRNDDYIRYDLSIICDDVEISHCHLVRNVFIGSYSKVNNSSIDSSSLLSHCVITHSELDNCVLHGSCTVESRSTLSAVLMFPHSGVSHGAIVEESVLGPDCSIACGECRRSLLGPFVGFHHQSLLIAASWPLGRGNVAYGSMIGANHTGRTNDQEGLPGEGCFFGLGVSVKFPFSVVYSPYTLIASGTNLISQKISFPFSLVSNYDSGAGANTLRPGWVLWSNPYFIERSITKFSKRRKSIEYRTDFPVFRPSIVDLVWDARNRLLGFKQSAVHSGNQQVLLSEQVLPGCGRSLVPLSDVDRAIDAYTQFIHRYALHGLLYMIATADSCKSNPQLEAESSLGPDSDSEEEDRLHSQMGLYKSSGPFSFILDDIRKMEINLGTIEDALLRGDIKKDGFSGKRGNDQLSIAPNTLLASLIGRSGSCCLLTDSHDYTVRRHQLRILSEEFSDIDFVKFIESCARGGIVSYNAITVQLAPKIKQLLLRLVDLERAYADGVFNCKQKDYPRAQEIITGMGDRGSEIDDTISRARIRADEIGICVHRVVSQL